MSRFVVDIQHMLQFDDVDVFAFDKTRYKTSLHFDMEDYSLLFKTKLALTQENLSSRVTT